MPSEYGNFLLLTRESSLTPVSAKMINDATKQVYILNKMVKNRPEQTLVQEGKFITERIKLGNQNRFRNYKPGEKRTPGRVTTVANVSWAWRFYTNDFPYTDAEILLNTGADKATAFKGFKRSMMQELTTDHVNGQETILWNLPDFAQMEDLQLVGGQAYSIPTFITETPQLAPGWSAAGGTTVGGVSPTTWSSWDNQRRSYNSADPYGNGGIVSAFDQMDLDLQWEATPNFQEYSENDDLQRLMIFTTKAGRAMYSNALRLANDHTRAGTQDPSYGSPVWQGRPVMFSDVLSEAPLEQNGGALQNTPYPVDRPRFYFINGQYLYPIWHRQRWQQISDPKDGGVERPDTEVVFMTSWYNLICTSRRRQGIIYPQ